MTRVVGIFVQNPDCLISMSFFYGLHIARIRNTESTISCECHRRKLHLDSNWDLNDDQDFSALLMDSCS